MLLTRTAYEQAVILWPDSESASRLREQCALQGGAAGRADAESAQEDAVQLQTPVVAAEVKQDVSITTDIAAHARARNGTANDPMHAIQDVDKPAEHTGKILPETHRMLVASCQLHAVWHSCLCKCGRHAVCTMVIAMGSAQQGTWALRHGLEPLSPARHVAQSAQRSLRSQARCAFSGAPLAPIVSSHALLALLMCKQ